MVVGSRHDPVASDVVAAWAPQGAALLTCEDLSTPGWRYRLPGRSVSTAVVGGTIVPEREIRGVLVRRLSVMAIELDHIAAPDREYVAAEMNAFLLAWLASLSCAVLNRPNGTCLCGPDWQALQWTHAAARAGIDVDVSHWRVPALRRSRRRITSEVAAAPLEVTVIGERCLGAPSHDYAASARRLAVTANTRLLTVRFNRGTDVPCFHSASAFPDLKDEEIARAVRDHLLS